MSNDEKCKPCAVFVSRLMEKEANEQRAREEEIERFLREDEGVFLLVTWAAKWLLVPLFISGCLFIICDRSVVGLIYAVMGAELYYLCMAITHYKPWWREEKTMPCSTTPKST